MSKLDKAFFKAYGPQDSPPPSELIRLSEAIGRLSAEDSPAAHDAPAEAELVEPALRPMLQVDAFAWPALLAEGTSRVEAGLDAVAAALVDPGGRRQTIVAMAGSAAQAGCTTLLLGAAQRLARRGARVVLVDADEKKADLSVQLGLAPSLGWEDVAAGRQPLAEALIESVEDRLTLLPLCRPERLARLAHQPAASSRMASAMAALRQNFDLVLVDLGMPDRWVTGAIDGAIDAAIVVHNVANAPGGKLRSAIEALAARGIACAGVIENFATVSASSRRRAA